MDTRIVTWLLTTVTCVAAVEAQAEGWYVFAGFGASFTEDINGSVEGVPLREGYGTGFMVFGGSGYRTGPYRLEGELTYAQHAIDTVSLGGTEGPTGGDRSTLAGLANFYVDFETATRWTPYVGAGIGVASVALNDVSPSSSVRLDDSDTVFAFQLKAGLAYTLRPSTQFSIGYRFLSADDSKLRDASGMEVSIEGPQLHTVETGLLYRF